MIISFNQFNVTAHWDAALSDFHAAVADVGVGLVEVFLKLVFRLLALHGLNQRVHSYLLARTRSKKACSSFARRWKLHASFIEESAHQISLRLASPKHIRLIVSLLLSLKFNLDVRVRGLQ